MAGLKTIIGLSFVLACGFLLVILSCALFSNWLPLLVVATYILAPLPNAICARYAAGEDFMSDSAGGAYHDLGKFITGFLVVTGLALPVALFHSNIIAAGAMVMSILGGLLIYGTITVYSHFFSTVTEEF